MPLRGGTCCVGTDLSYAHLSPCNDNDASLGHSQGRSNAPTGEEHSKEGALENKGFEHPDKNDYHDTLCPSQATEMHQGFLFFKSGWTLGARSCWIFSGIRRRKDQNPPKSVLLKGWR